MAIIGASKPKKRGINWPLVRVVFTVVVGAITLLMGVRQNNAAMMTVGGGLVGFSPIAKGNPCPEPGS